MYKEERISRIMQMLQEKKTLSKKEIAEAFGVSQDSARRDILKLVEQGLAIRTHGGITIADFQAEILAYRKRGSINTEVKKELAQHAANYLKPMAGKEHRVCFFDVSTTIELLCDYVPDHFTIYTHSLDNVERLSRGRCKTHIVGGKLQRKLRYFYGSESLDQLEGIHFDLAFLGAGSLQWDGVYVGDREDAAIKRKVAQRSDLVYVLVDDTKYNPVGNFLAVPFGRVDKIMTNQCPPDDLLQSMERNGTTLELVGAFEQQPRT